MKLKPYDMSKPLLSTFLSNSLIKSYDIATKYSCSKSDVLITIGIRQGQKYKNVLVNEPSYRLTTLIKCLMLEEKGKPLNKLLSLLKDISMIDKRLKYLYMLLVSEHIYLLKVAHLLKLIGGEM